MRVGTGDIPDYTIHHTLFARQAVFVGDNWDIVELVSYLYCNSGILNDYEDSFEEAIAHHADAHPKRELRIRAYAELCTDGLINKCKDPWLRGIRAKVKREEVAKPGTIKKPGIPRLIMDLGVSASLRGFRLTELMKQAMYACPIEVGGGVIKFCKSPNLHDLHDIFHQLISPAGRFFFLYFSDDSCLAIRIRGEVLRYNLDISKCDASHGPPIFRVLRRLFPEWCREDLDILVEQCNAPFVIQDLIDRKNRVILKPEQEHLYSGSTLTTVTNNVACILLGLALSKIPEADWSKATIEEAAASVGYVLTGTSPVERIEDLQFLKHSPIRDDCGVYRPLLNLGPFLRASGYCKGDLPGRGELSVRARDFQIGLVRGAFPRTIIPFLEVHARALGAPTREETVAIAAKTFASKVSSDDKYPIWRVDETSLQSRYRLSDLHWAELYHWAEHVGYGQVYNSEAAGLILNTDYGLSMCDEDRYTYHPQF